MPDHRQDPTPERYQSPAQTRNGQLNSYAEPTAVGNFAFGVLRSQDDGLSWQSILPGVGDMAVQRQSLDPYLFADPVTDRVWYENSQTVTAGINSWSDDGGDSWSHSYSGGLQTDHQTVFVGPAVTSTLLDYPNVVYRCAMSGGALVHDSTMITCQRSLTGGDMWLPPGEPAYVFAPDAVSGVWPQEGGLAACSGGTGHGFASSTGRIYLPRGHCRQPWLAWSDDEGMTWTRQQVSDIGIFCSAYTIDSPGVCAHDGAAGFDAAGTLYYVFHAPDRMLYMTRSQDGGSTWDAPRVVNAPSLNGVTHAQLIAGGAGRVALAYYGTRNLPTDPVNGDYTETTWDAFLAVSLDADQAEPTFATAQLNNGGPLITGYCSPFWCPAVQDFIDLRISPRGEPWAPFIACDPTDCSNIQNGLAFGGRLANVNLWDSADMNGPYPNGTT